MPALNDDLTPEELAYIESGGKTELPITPAPAASEPAPEPVATPTAPVTTPAPADPAAAAQPDAKGLAAEVSDDDDDEIDEGEYIKDAQGRLRDPKTNRFVKMVPIHAVHKVREKHKVTKAELEKLRILNARGEERLAVLNEAFNGQSNQQPAQVQPPKKEEEPNPFEEPTIDHLQDFVGAFEQMNRRNAWMQKQLQKTEQRASGIEQQSQHRDAMTVLRNTYHSDVQSFRQQTPDFMDAYQHLVKGRLAELELQGVRDPLKRKAIVEQEETQLVAQALQSNQSPAQLIYGVAKARGYAAKPAAPAPAAPAPNAAAEKIRQLQNGQNAAQTLSNVGGQAAPTLTYESLARMNQEEFNAVADKLTEKQLMKFLGGP